jgi:hypothetical protein
MKLAGGGPVASWMLKVLSMQSCILNFTWGFHVLNMFTFILYDYDTTHQLIRILHYSYFFFSLYDYD